jgi:hypothetical protein
LFFKNIICFSSILANLSVKDIECLPLLEQMGVSFVIVKGGVAFVIVKGGVSFVIVKGGVANIFCDKSQLHVHLQSLSSVAACLITTTKKISSFPLSDF